MWSLWIYCDQGHRQEGFIDEDGLVLVPDGCDVCEDILNGARRPSKLRMWREIHKLRKSINRMER